MQKIASTAFVIIKILLLNKQQKTKINNMLPMRTKWKKKVLFFKFPGDPDATG
jgi:hypothetical protein